MKTHIYAAALMALMGAQSFNVMAQERSARTRDSVAQTQDETLLRNNVNALRAKLQGLQRETQRRMACQQTTKVSTATGCQEIPGLEDRVRTRVTGSNTVYQNTVLTGGVANTPGGDSSGNLFGQPRTGGMNPGVAGSDMPQTGGMNPGVAGTDRPTTGGPMLPAVNRDEPTTGGVANTPGGSWGQPLTGGMNPGVAGTDRPTTGGVANTPGGLRVSPSAW